jgi:hypothetical protein
VIALAVAGAVPTIAKAKSIPQDELTSDDGVVWLRHRGLVSIAPAGNKIVLSTTSGTSFSVWLLDCQQTSLRMDTVRGELPNGRKIAGEQIDDWNRQKR